MLKQYVPAIRYGNLLDPLTELDGSAATNGQTISWNSTTKQFEFGSGVPTGLDEGKILVGDNTNTAQAVTPSQDVSLADDGSFTVTGVRGHSIGELTDAGASWICLSGSFIGNTNGAVSGSGSTYNESAFIIGAVKHVTTGGSSSEPVTIHNIDVNSGIIVTLNSAGTNNVSIVRADYTDANTVTVVFSGDPGNDAVVSVMATRLVSYLD
jgi:hypothetical protein